MSKQLEFVRLIDGVTFLARFGGYLYRGTIWTIAPGIKGTTIEPLQITMVDDNKDGWYRFHFNQPVIIPPFTEAQTTFKTELPVVMLEKMDMISAPVYEDTDEGMEIYDISVKSPGESWYDFLVRMVPKGTIVSFLSETTDKGISSWIALKGDREYVPHGPSAGSDKELASFLAITAIFEDIVNMKCKTAMRRGDHIEIKPQS